MGGGVSLGAFNGGAIAEITRQLHDNLNPELYDGAEIDVFVFSVRRLTRDTRRSSS